MIRQPESKSALKRKKRHRRRALRIAFLVSIVILVMFAVVMLVAFALQKTGWLPESSSAGSSAPPAATTTPPATTTTTEPATTTATFAGGTTAIGSGQVADSYFDDAAFIGDSRTQGLQLYTGLPNATFYATQGLMVDTFFSKKFVKAGGGKITIPDAMQKLQMTTQEGNNVGVCAIRGNFDDAQNGVKAIFTDKAVGDELARHGMMFSSANSINWGRLVPQIVYYVSAYCDLLASGEVAMGQAINVVVPTGNFGNILAAYYAKKMGLPIAKLICASNRNRVLTDFIRTGTYDRNREFHATTSPSMDILISSNLERLLYDLAGRDDAEIRRLMGSLKETGRYTVPEAIGARIQDLFAAGWCDDEETAAAIAETYQKHGYLCDTHTAVAVHVYNEYRRETGDTTPTVIASTANPYKFSASVLDALHGGAAAMDEFDKVEALERLTGCEVPPPLAGLRGKTPRFTEVCSREEMPAVVYRLLGIQ